MTAAPPQTRLRELAAELDWPPTPDLAGGVLARIEADGPAPARASGAATDGGHRRRMPLQLGRRRPMSPELGRRRARAAVAAVVALLVAGAVVEPVRSAVLDVLGIAGRDRVIHVPSPPDTSRPALDRGATTTLARARERVGFVIGLPRALAAPSEVRVSDAIAGGAVTLVYPDAMLLEFEGGLDPVLQKRVGAGARARSVTVAGEPGFFITGVRELDVLDREGHPVQARRGLARADALVWQRGGVAYRLETRAGLRHALVIARSVDPNAD
ncbi:MAG: hypothetical protein QOJ89_5066 [bacterium]|jgi:hypothetical protein